MGFHRHLLATTALAALVSFSPAIQAQDSGSIQVGGATVSVGAGTAILGLPDVQSFVTRGVNAGSIPFINGFQASDDFGDELGWNVNASIAVPMGATMTVSLNGFWANIKDDDAFTCTSPAGQGCVWFSLVDDPVVGGQNNGAALGETVTSNAERDVDQWGVSLELKRQRNPGVMGVTQAPPQRYFTLGADIRGIDQDLDIAITSTRGGGGAFRATYTGQIQPVVATAWFYLILSTGPMPLRVSSNRGIFSALC